MIILYLQRGKAMKEIVKYARMLDIYGGILTEKQYDMLEAYYCNDLTMEEIAENNNVSKQAVHYAIKNAEEKIMKLEEQLQIMKKYDALECELESLKSRVDTGKASAEETSEALDKILREL